MHLHKAKCLLVQFLLVVGVLLAMAPAAYADQNTWLPDFDQGKHVYVDPKLSSIPSAPVRLDGLESQITQAAKKNHLAVYVIATERAQNPMPASGKTWGVTTADEVLARFSGRPGFRADDYLIIVWVRYQNDPLHGSFAANAGNRLRGYGITGAHLSDKSGPVITALKGHMPQDPPGAILTIVNNVSGEADTYLAAEQARIDHDKAMKRLPWIIGGIVLGIILIVLVVWLVLRRSRWSQRAGKLIAEWKDKLESSNAMYIKLEGSYLGFLQQQADWSTRFQGTTATKYKAAVTDFADFSVRQKRANNLVADAEKAANGCTFPSITGFQKAVSLLSEDKVEITGAELPLEMASLFGGVVAKTTYDPDQLLNAMEELFKRTVKALDSIMKAFSGAEQNKADITGLLAEIEALKGKLTEKELTFDPYSQRSQEIQTGLADFLGKLASDPLAAFAGSQEVEDKTRSLKADVERAISIKDALTPVEADINKAAERASSQRKQPLSYLYPLAGGETKPGSTAMFTLAEEAGDPDPIVAEARKHLAAAQEAVLAGQLDRADSEKGAAKTAADSADSLITSVLNAKAFVEKQVPATRGSFDRLQAAVPGADTAFAELKADFLAKNYDGQEGKLSRAKTVVSSTGGKLAQVKQAYDEQRYLAAQSLTTSLESSITSATGKLGEIHSCLASLRELRQHSRETIARCGDRVQTLQGKLSANSFTTSDATDREFQRLAGSIAAQKAEVGKPVTDWPAAAQAADQLWSSFDGIDRAIDDQKAAHDRADSEIRGLTSAISDAEAYVNDGDTRQPARNKLGQAKSALTDVQVLMRRPKSDWAAIGRQASDNRSLASAARDLAQKDKTAANDARSAIRRAESKIEEADRSYGYSVFVDLSSARSSVHSARSYLSSNSYEEAEREADRAYRQADAEEDRAEAAVAAAIAAIEAARREEERRQREAEEAARRAREEEERRSSYSSSSFDFGGGGGGSSSSSSDSSSGGGGYSDSSSGGGGYSDTGSGGGDY